MAGVRSVTFSPGGKSLASGGADGSVTVWDLAEDQERVASISTRADAAVAFSPDDRTLATSSSDGTAGLWDAATGKLRFNLEGWNGGALAFSPDSKTLASESQNHT